MYKFPIKKVFQGLTTAESRNDSFCCWDYSLSSSTLETAGLKFTNQHLLNKTNKKYISSDMFSLYEGSCFWLFLWRGSKRRRNNLATWRVVSSPSYKMKVILVICSVTGSFENLMKGRICEADVVHVESFLSFLPAGPLLRPPTVPHQRSNLDTFPLLRLELWMLTVACSRWMQISLTMVTKMATRPR